MYHGLRDVLSDLAGGERNMLGSTHFGKTEADLISSGPDRALSCS